MKSAWNLYAARRYAGCQFLTELQRRHPVSDVLFIGVGIGCFALMALYARALARL